MFCTKCGTQNPSANTFCKNCGRPLKQSPSSSPVNLYTESTQQQNAQQGNVESLAPDSSYQHIQSISAHASTAPASVAAGKTQHASKKNRLIIGIALVAILAAVVACVLIIGHFGVAAVSPKDSVNDYTWGELSKISEEISKASNESDAVDIARKYNLVTEDGKLDGKQTKNVELANGKTIPVQIVGFAHDEKTAGGKAGITFVFQDAITARQMNTSDSNLGGWEQSDIRSWLATDGMNLLPEDLKDLILEVEKKTNNSGDTTEVSSVTSTSDKLWLPSNVELCGPINWYSVGIFDSIINSEGVEYKLYRDANVKTDEANPVLTIELNDKSTSWWKRSPTPEEPSGFAVITSKGNPHYGEQASASLGIAPGFCI